MELKWQAPPPSNRGRGGNDYSKIAAALRERPGEWALIKESVASNNSYYIRKRLQEIGAFEVTQRSVGGQKIDVYARAVA